MSASGLTYIVFGDFYPNDPQTGTSALLVPNYDEAVSWAIHWVKLMTLQLSGQYNYYVEIYSTSGQSGYVAYDVPSGVVQFYPYI